MPNTATDPNIASRTHDALRAVNFPETYPTSNSRRRDKELSLRLIHDLVQNALQLLEVVFRQPEILGIRSVEIGSAKAVNDADRIFLGVYIGGFGEDLFYKFANAPDAVVPHHPKTVAFGKLADLQSIKILARIDDYRAAAVW